MDGLGTLIGGLTGVVGSVTPAVIEAMEKKSARDHELAMRKMELELAAQGHEFKAIEKSIDVDIAELTKIYEHDMSLKGSVFIDAMRASVRPIITFTFFGAYLFIKFSALVEAWAQGVPITVAVPTLWSGDDQAIFAAVISFWFGQRAMQRFGPFTSGSMTGNRFNNEAKRMMASPVRVLKTMTKPTQAKGKK